MKALTKVNNFSKYTKIFFLFWKKKKTFHLVWGHYVTQLLIHHYKSFVLKSQLLLNQVHHRNIHCNSIIFHIHVYWFISLGCNTNLCIRFNTFPLPYVWKQLCWFISCFSFLSRVRIFYVFSFITHSKECMLNMKIFQFSNQYICISSVTEFSKEQNKLSISTNYHKHYYYRTFLADLQWDYF